MNDVLDAYRSFLAEPRVPDPPARSWRDRALASVMVVLVLFEVAVRADMPLRLASLVLGLALAPTLLWRRSHPLATVACAFGALTACDLPRYLGDRPPFELYSSGLVMLLPYALFRWGSGRDAVRGFAIMVVPAVAATVFDFTGVADAVGGWAVFLAVAAVALAMRYRGRARQRELAEVKLVERERLARDLHDTVAHHVSAIAIRAQAGLATAPTNPGAALDSLRIIEAEASRTLAEMRAMVRYLRVDDPADRAPTPLIGDLPQLASAGPGGPRVEVALAGAVDEVPTAVSTAIYRIAQESVTNARRHARNATRIEVGVIADRDTVHLRVRDDGESAGHRSVAGYGVQGMIERATLLGGRCEAGPDARRGWTVSAVVPRREPT